MPQIELANEEESEEVKRYLESISHPHDEILLGLLAEIQEKEDSFNKRVSFNFNRWCEDENLDATVRNLCKQFRLEAQKETYDSKKVFNVTKIVLLNLHFARLMRGKEYWIA
jgi:hypothetical protein